MSVWKKLTARQHEVMLALCETGTDTDAGAKLGITRRTIEHHMALIRAKVGPLNRGQLMLAFDRWARMQISFHFAVIRASAACGFWRLLTAAP